MDRNDLSIGNDLAANCEIPDSSMNTNTNELKRIKPYIIKMQAYYQKGLIKAWWAYGGKPLPETVVVNEENS